MTPSFAYTSFQAACYSCAGGAEHAVLHLLYARFWHKVLYDIGVVTRKEPFQSLVSQGMILGEVRPYGSALGNQESLAIPIPFCLLLSAIHVSLHGNPLVALEVRSKQGRCRRAASAADKCISQIAACR